MIKKRIWERQEGDKSFFIKRFKLNGITYDSIQEKNKRFEGMVGV